MSEIILPTAEPFTATLPSEASAVSILLAHKAKTFPWLMNNFIQLIGQYNNQYIGYSDFVYDNCPFIECQRISTDIIKENINDELLLFLISSLDKQYYIRICVATKYIPAYKMHAPIHDLFIFGYNTQEKCFYIADHFVGGKYSKSKCSFDDMDKATKLIASEDISETTIYSYNIIELLSYRNDMSLLFDIKRVKKLIEDYLLSRPSIHWYISYPHLTQDEIESRTYGLKTYDVLRNHITFAVKNKELNSDWAYSFYRMWEHKRIMLLRLEYMYQNNYITDIDHLTAKYLYIEKKAKQCLDMIVKYYLQHNDSILDRVKVICDEIEDLERIALYNLLEIIKDL